MTDLTFSNYFGGSKTDQGYDLCFFDKDYIYLAGRTQSNEFPFKNNVFDSNESFILRLLYDYSNKVDNKHVYLHNSISINALSPNPFNSITTINYSLQKAAFTKIVIYNINGQKVSEVFSGFQEAGTYSKNWRPKGLSSGLYFVNIDIIGSKKVKKALYLK